VGRMSGTMGVQPGFISSTGAIPPTSNVSAWSSSLDPFTFAIFNLDYTDYNNTNVIHYLPASNGYDGPSDLFEAGAGLWRLHFS